MSEGPVIIVTGASSGIGRATAILFAKHKCRLSLSGRDDEALTTVIKDCIQAGNLFHDDVIATVGDLRDESVAKDLIKHTIDKFGQINALVNSAGILVTGSLQDTPIKDYDRQFDVNVRSVIQLTRLAVPYLILTKGTIVNVSSIAGPCPIPNHMYYCMSKAALDQFTKCLALELAPHSVRVNSVNPGVIVTNIHRRAGMSEEEYSKDGGATHPLGRVGSCDEVAESIYFLASSSSSFCTGNLLMIDGGRNLVIPC